MAIYTTITPELINPWLDRLGLGKTQSLQGITEGIENSNYFLTTSHPHAKIASVQFVLTVFERSSAEHLSFYLEWLTWLANQALPVPRPIALDKVNGKPVLIAQRLIGEKCQSPVGAHAWAMGQSIAALHVASLNYQKSHAHLPINPRGLAWQKSCLPTLQGKVTDEEWRLLHSASEPLWAMAERWHDDMHLPRAPVHGDLFRDNVFFAPTSAANPPRVSGIFDFFFGGVDWLIFDLAVAINDWCSYRSEDLDASLSAALLGGYESVRPLGEAEKSHLPAMQAFAALRFWLSRLSDVAYPRAGQVIAHDPQRFAKIVRHRLLAL